MGGPGSGRRPKEPRPEAEIEADPDIQEAAQEAAAVAKALPPKKAPKPKETKKRTAKNPSAYKDHPLAFAMNAFADKVGQVPPGTAQQCQLGQAWMAVADFYLGDVTTHPVAVAVVATGQFAIVAGMARAQGKRQGTDKKPGDNLFSGVMDEASKP